MRIGSLRCLTHGGAGLHPSVRVRFAERWGTNDAGVGIVPRAEGRRSHDACVRIGRALSKGRGPNDTGMRVRRGCSSRRLCRANLLLSRRGGALLPGGKLVRGCGEADAEREE